MALKSQEIIKDMNYHNVLERIISEGYISRADLAKKLGLTKATISSLVQELLDENLILEVGALETSKGRRPIQLTFHASYGYVISADIRLNSINFLLSDMIGRHCYLRQYGWDGSKERLLDLLHTGISHMRANAPDTEKGLIGICLAIHGTVFESQVIFTPYYDLDGLNLQESLHKAFQAPVYLENEANLAALGERTFSFQSSNMLNINVHSGIGLGVIVNDQLYVGKNGFAGEFGHTIVNPAGIPCPCGNQGCIEQYASEKAILKKYNHLKNDGSYTADQLIAAYHHEESEAITVMKDFIQYISIGINNAINIFNPDFIVINSIFTSQISGLIHKIKKQLKNRMAGNCTIVPSTLQDTASLLGGVYVCSKSYLKINELSPPLV